MELIERTEQSTRVYNGVIVNVEVDAIKLPNGRPARREVVRHPGGVAILPLHDDETVTVVRQFRYPFSRVLTEIPAGKLEYGEEPLACALRELEEEVGLSASDVAPLGCIYPSPGYSGEILYLYLARGLKQGDCHPDPDEFLEIDRVPFADLVAQVMSGEQQDAKTVAAVLKVGRLLNL